MKRPAVRAWPFRVQCNECGERFSFVGMHIWPDEPEAPPTMAEEAVAGIEAILRKVESRPSRRRARRERSAAGRPQRPAQARTVTCGAGTMQVRHRG